MIAPRRHRALGCLALLAIALLIALGLYAWQTGPRDDVDYPPKAGSPYRLPWAEGEARFCVQGNRAVVSHREDGEFAWDFVMPVGTKVLAMRDGRVVRVVDHHDGNGTDKPNNLVSVDHGDGTVGHYLHLRRGGALVKVGQVVRRGEAVAESGNVGRSMLPHVHVQVTRDGQTIPISFGDAPEPDGIPRMLRTYTSGNRAAATRPTELR